VIRDERDPEVVNRLAGGDFTEFLEEPLHHCLIDGDSGAFFAFRGPGIYEAHVFFTVRGKDAIDLGHALMDRMRERGARQFWSMIPPESRHVKVFLRRLGWHSHGTVISKIGPQELFSTEKPSCHP